MLEKLKNYNKRLFILFGLKLMRVYGIYITFSLLLLGLLLVFRMIAPLNSGRNVVADISLLDLFLYISAIFCLIISVKWFVLSAQKIPTLLQEIDNIRAGKGKFRAPDSPALLLVPIIIALVTDMSSNPQINTHEFDALKVFELVYYLGYVFLLMASVNGILLNAVASDEDNRMLGSAIVIGVAIWTLLLELGKRLTLSLILLSMP